MVDTQAARTKTLFLPRTETVTNSQGHKNDSDVIMSSPGIRLTGNKKEANRQIFTIYHQKIQGLNGKIDELMVPLTAEMPHLICLTEHHLRYNEIEVAHIPNYKLGARYCRTNLKCGGVGIYVHNNIKYYNINLLKYCKELDIEIVAIKIKFAVITVIVLCVYRAPGGNLDYFIEQLDCILNRLKTPKTEYIICGDLNINFLGDNSKKTKVEN